MNLRTLNYFLVTAEELNFTRAAEKLHMTQQSLSGNIRRIEEEYGVELFQRKPVVRLTPAGEMMMFYAQQMLKNEAQMMAGFADLSANCSGHLRLGMSRQRSSIFLPGIWERYYPFHKNISVSMYEATTTAMVNSLQNGELDMFVGIDVAPMRNLSIIPIATEYMCCFLSERLLREYMPDCWGEFLERSQKEGVDILALKELPFLMLSRGNRIRMTADQVFASGSVMPKIILETAEQNVLYKLACEARGAALFSPIVLYDYARGHRRWPEDCHLLKIRNDIAANEVSLVSRKDIPLPGYAGDMKNAIIQEFASYMMEVERITEGVRG